MTPPPVGTLPPAAPDAAQAPRPGAAAHAGLRARLLGVRASDRFWGWVGPLLVAVLGGFARFWHLDRPSTLVFDETYYVKQGVSYLRAGYELRFKPDPSKTVKTDDLFAQGNLDVFQSQPDFVVHPPVGKWMIAAGQFLFGGDNPWGWRFSAALVGTLSILMLGRIARRLLGSTLLGTTAALLLAVDGQHFVHSRTGLLDVFIMFWALAAFGCLLLDRDWARARLARRFGDGVPTGRLGPWLGFRPWRLAAAVCLGLCCGVKWSGLYFLALFLLMSVLWDLAARRAAGVRRWFLGGIALDGVPAALTTLPVALAAYLASWTGWFRSSGGYFRTWASGTPATASAPAVSGVPADPGWGWVPDALRSLWHYHAEMYHFHVTLTSSHPYQSNPWSWLVLGRPTAFFYKDSKLGEGACDFSVCSRAVHALGNPVVWWGGTLAVAVLVFWWLLGRDWRAGAILAGLAAGWLPWFAYQERTIYTFYAVAFVPWVVLALTFAIGLLLGPRDAPPDRRLRGAVVGGGVVVVAVALFAFFYPVLAGELISHAAWVDRMWLSSWI